MGRFTQRIWSPAEVYFLQEHYGKKPITQIEIDLARGRSSIIAYATKLGLTDDVSQVRPKPAARSGQGRRPDLGISVRSAWEANVLRWLTHQNIRWQYEPKTFYFEGEKRGATSYTPDIFLPDLDLWIEVKGQFKSDARSKMRKFEKHYPKEFAKLRCVPGTGKCQAAVWFAKFGVPVFALYNVLRFDYALQLPHWEHDSTSVRWLTSKRTRKRPSDETLPLAAPKVPAKRKAHTTNTTGARRNAGSTSRAGKRPTRKRSSTTPLASGTAGSHRLCGESRRAR